MNPQTFEESDRQRKFYCSFYSIKVRLNQYP
nr:MAG TPA: hypothetical protein [Caudoviricetes sp.]